MGASMRPLCIGSAGTPLHVAAASSGAEVVGELYLWETVVPFEILRSRQLRSALEVQKLCD